LTNDLALFFSEEDILTLTDKIINNIILIKKAFYHFITGRTVSGAWWNGPNKGFEGGFMYITFKADDFRWRYVDYGWNVKTR